MEEARGVATALENVLLKCMRSYIHMYVGRIWNDINHRAGVMHITLYFGLGPLDISKVLSPTKELCSSFISGKGPVTIESLIVVEEGNHYILKLIFTIDALTT